MSLSKKIINFLESIKSKKDILIEQEILGRPIREVSYKGVNEDFKMDFKKMFHPVFSEHKELEIILKADEEVICECSIESLIYIFNEEAQRDIYTDETLSPKFTALVKKLYPLDVYRHSLDAVTLTAINPIDEDTLEFYIWNNSGHKYKLKFKTFEEYVNCAIDNKFIVFWQYFYIDTDAMDFDDTFTKEWLASDYSNAIRRMEDALETMEKYFTEDDWSYQKEEYNRVVALNQKQ